jgi:serine/threonine protein phosphatase Stp1
LPCCSRGEYYACLWAGDSRAYFLRKGRLHQLTHDHSLVQELVDSGAIGSEEALRHPRRNIITRALGGADETAELDKVTDRLRQGDRLLLCSDGLFKTVAEPDLGELLAEGDDRSAERLVAAALERNADDNVTAVAVDVLDDRR